MEIENFGKVYCQKILPAVYDDSLAFYEVVCKLADKVNEIINEVNNFNLDNYATKDELYSKLVELKTELINYFNLENAKQTVMLKAHTLAKLNEAVSNLENQITNYKLSDIKIIDPENSFGKVNYQNVIYNQNQNYRTFADSVASLELKDKTAAIRDSMMLTAYEFDFSSSFYYSIGNLPISNYDGNYFIQKLGALFGTGGIQEEYVKKHDIQAYYFERKL